MVVTGLGCISPVGNDIGSAWDSLIAGKSGVGPITHYDASEFKVHFAAEVKGFDGPGIFGAREACKMDRFTQLALAASQQAVKQAGLEISDSNRERVGVIIGTGIGGIGTLFEQLQVFSERGPLRVSPFLVPMMLPDTAAGMVAIHFGIRGINMAVVTACATGTNAIGEAAEAIRRGTVDVILAGGAEAAIVPIAMAGLSVMTALSTRNDDPQGASRPFDKDRDGFVIGEGAGVLVLESLEHARGRGAAILAEISGYGSTNDAYHISAPAENGAGAAACMRQALRSAGLTPVDISYINAHGTSTPLNDKSETAAIKSVFGEQALPHTGLLHQIDDRTPDGRLGALEAAICVQVLQQNILPPTINYTTPDPACDLDYVPNQARPAAVEHILSNSFGFGGHNASIILSRYTNG